MCLGTLILLFLCLVFPPLAVFLKTGLSAHLLINVILTFFPVFPWFLGVVHALLVVLTGL